MIGLHVVRRSPVRLVALLAGLAGGTLPVSAQGGFRSQEVPGALRSASDLLGKIRRDAALLEAWESFWAHHEIPVVPGPAREPMDNLADHESGT